MGEIADSLRQREDQEREFKIQSAIGVHNDPDRADRIFAVSAKTELPDEIVDADLENLEDKLKRDEFDINAYRDQMNGSPVFNRFAAENPYHPTVLERDRQSLTRLERALEPIFMSWDAGWATTEIAEIQDRQIAGDTRPEDEAELKRLRQLVSGGHFGVENKFAKFLTGTAKQLPIQSWLITESAEETMAGGMIGGSIGLAGGFGIGAVPGFFTGMGAGLLAGRTEAAFRLERGLAFDEFKELGLDEDDSLLVANAVGAVNAALESTGLGVITKRLPGFRQIQRDATGEVVSRIFKDNTFRAATARLTAAYGETMAVEIITEVLQESTLYAGREYLKGEARLAGDLRPETMPAQPGEFWDIVKETAIETMYGTALIAGAGPVSQYYRESQNLWRAERMAEAWKSVGKAAKDTEMREKSPNKYMEFVRRLTESGKYESVSVDANEFVTYFQDQGIDPDEVAAKLDVNVEELEEGVSLGQDISIPVDKYLTKIAATEYHEGLIPYLKTGDNLSLKDAELFSKNHPEIVKQIEDLAANAVEDKGAAQIESIVQDVTQQLTAAGYETGASAQLAQIMRGIGVLAQRNNMDPTALYEQIFGGVRRVTKEAQAVRDDVDMFVDPLLDRLRAQDFPAQREMFGPSLMDLINESGGIDPTDAELSAMDFELGAQEIGVSKAKLKRWSTEGKSLASIAEIAAEQGYIVSRDENLLIDALRREIDGEPVYGTQEAGSAGLRDLGVKLEQLAEFIEQAGLDIDNMTNQEIREALEKQETFAQIDTKELNDLTALVMQQVGLAERVEGADATIGRLAASLPMLAETQDFGDVAFTDTVQIQETGDTAKVKVSAQKEFDAAVKRKNVLKRLLDCVSG